MYPPGRTCSIDSALPTWNLPGALESRCGGSIMFSRTSAANHGVESKDKAQIHSEIRVKKTDGVKTSKNLGRHNYQEVRVMNKTCLDLLLFFFSQIFWRQDPMKKHTNLIQSHILQGDHEH